MSGSVEPTRLSIERKLPLIIGGLLVLAIVAISALALVEVRATSLEIAAERLTGARDQLRQSLQQSAVNLRAQAAAVAARPGIAAFAASRGATGGGRDDPRLRDRALEDLRLPGQQPDAFLGAELRDASGRVLLSTFPDGSAIGGQAVAVNDVLPRTEPGDSAIVGSFRAIGDTLVYPIAAAVPGGRGRDDLYVVRWRRLGAGRRSLEVIQNLIGSDAALLIGNAGGGAWSDFERVVRGPATAGAGAMEAGVHSYEREDGSEFVASLAAIPGTPWVVAVGFPRARVMEPLNHFARRQASVALVVLLLGLVAAWLLSRRITQPLATLTDAARRMTAGDMAQRVEIRSGDELEVLGDAFTQMAAEVRQTRDELEHRVEQRTSDLNATLVQLHDAQDALVRRERLAMLGQLSSGVGHELRNPLGVMTNAVYYLKTVLSQQPANVHEYLEILTQQITLSEKIVGDLLDFTREKAPQRKPAFVREAVETQVQRLGPRDGVRIDVDTPDDLPPALVDPVHLGQIVLNLLTNAVQAMEGSGQLTVRARPNGTMQHVEVSDTGPGVAPQNREKIFEPLFTTKARGIGLGLAVSRTLARANGGDLTLVTEPGGRGATFRLSLPIATEAAP